MLAQNEEGGLVKLAMPGVPMVDDYCFSDPAAMTLEEEVGMHYALYYPTIICDIVIMISCYSVNVNLYVKLLTYAIVNIC